MPRAIFWLNQLGFTCRTGSQGTGRATRPWRRLSLEDLECRCVPSTVTNLADAGPGSLRDALATTSIGGTVDFEPCLSGTITLTSGSLAITQDLTLTGLGAAVLTISGNSLLPVLNIAPAIAVAIAGLTIANGKNSGPGGGIFNAGLLTLTDCILMGNSVQSSSTASGGAIYNSGTLTVTDSTLSNNRAGAGLLAGAFGGAINNSGTMIITTCTLTDNSVGADYVAEGGAIRNSGLLAIADCALSNNSAASGGAISNTGTLTITNSSLNGNTSMNRVSYGGGISNAGMLTISHSTIRGNVVIGEVARGGGIENNGQLSMLSSSIMDNSTNGSVFNDGGGIYNTGILAVNGCTVSNNTAGSGPQSTSPGDGGGIYNTVARATATVRNSTISGNQVHSGLTEGRGLEFIATWAWRRWPIAL